MEENNKLIAEFMELDNSDPYNDTNNYGNYVSKYLYMFNDEYFNYDANIEFNESWGLLMPVVEKISNIQIENAEVYWQSSSNDGFYISVGDCTKGVSSEGHYWNHLYKGSDVDTTFDGSITNVYESVVEFIKWYNKQKKK